MKQSILFFVLLFAIAWQNITTAGGERWSSNTNLLPQYCKDRAKGSSSPEWSKWRGTFGHVFIHVHHYCAGIFAEQKAKIAVNQRERVNWLGKTVTQMQYVATACNAKCVIYPELHTRWGWALGEQGQTAGAIQHFQLAFQAKPDYAPAYARLSELYIEINQPEDARKALQSGLKASPNSKMLKRRLDELGSG